MHYCTKREGPSSLLLRQLCPSALSQAPKGPGNVEQGKAMIPVSFYPHETALSLYVPCNGGSTPLLSSGTAHNNANPTPHHFLERLSAACHARRGRLRGRPPPLATATTTTWPITMPLCSVHYWHLGERRRAMGIFCAAGGTVQLRPRPAYEEGRLHCRPRRPTASQQQLLPQPGCHLWLLLPRDPMPPPLEMTVTTISRLNDRLLLPNLDDSPNIITSPGQSRQRHHSLASSRKTHYDDLRSNSHNIQMKYPPSAWKYALKLKLQQLKLKASKGVKKTQHTIRKAKSSPVIRVQLQAPTAGSKTAHVPRSKRGSQKHKTVPVPKL